MKLLRLVAYILMGWYLLLLTVHYFNQRPLWNDEACVFNSVLNYGPSQMFGQALMNIQQFPKTYLYLIQQVAQAFDWHLLALRFLPFICMMIAFLLWMRIAHQLFADTWWMVLFVACWVGSIPLIYYGAELKQYSMDTMSAALFIWFLLNEAQWAEAKRARWLVCLPLLGLFSYPALLFLPLPLINAWVASGKRLRFSSIMWFYLSVAMMVVLVVYWVDIRVSVKDLKDYWMDYFISLNSPLEFFRTLGESVNNLIGRWFAINPKWIRGASRFFIGIGFAYLLITCVGQWLKDKKLFIRLMPIGGFIFIELFTLSILHKYTFSVPRVVLFFAPILLMATVFAMQWLSQKNRLVGAVLSSVFFLFLVTVSYGIAAEVLAGDLGAEKTLFMQFK